MSDPPQDLLTCNVCLGRLQDPHLLSDCGHTFCRACIYRIQGSGHALRVGAQCPRCRRPFRPNQVLPNLALRALLNPRVNAQLFASDHRVLDAWGNIHSSADMTSTSAPHAASGESIVRSSDGAAQSPTVESLTSQGCSAALARLVIEESRQIALRIFLLDNSHSTTSSDGKVLVNDPVTRRRRWQCCTRWEEVCHMAVEHARWNIELGTPAEFILLNGQAPMPTPACTRRPAANRQSRRTVSLGGLGSLASRRAAPPRRTMRRATTATDSNSLSNPVLGVGSDIQDELSLEHEGIESCFVDTARGDCDAQVEAVNEMLMNTGPRGVTPIAHRLREIYARLLPQARDLARSGQQVVLVIVTDGMPTGIGSAKSTRHDRDEVVQELRRLSADLPIHIVIRLCTDDSAVAEFYNGVDAELELQLEVVDDMKSEAIECRKAGNRFFVYSPFIHRLREGGTFLKVLDLVDERRLEPMEVALLCRLLLRQDPDDPPYPSDPLEFCMAVRQILPKCAPVFDPVSQTMVSPVLLHEVEAAVMPRSESQRQCGDNCECIVM